MRSALFVAVSLLAATAARAEPGTGPRVWLGPAAALDPAFAAATGGADWFVTPGGALGLVAAHTFSGTGDQFATERAYGFANLIGRLRASHGERLRVELLGGVGVARIRFGTPGAHTEVAPDLLFGAAIGWQLRPRWELAAELGAHVTLGERAAARNSVHTSELFALLVRWGG